MQKGRDE